MARSALRQLPETGRSTPTEGSEPSGGRIPENRASPEASVRAVATARFPGEGKSETGIPAAGRPERETRTTTSSSGFPAGTFPPPPETRTSESSDVARP